MHHSESLSLDSIESPNQPTANQPMGNRSLITTALLGLAICTVIGVIDYVLLQVAVFEQWTGTIAYVVFAVFILQTAVLGAFVGSRVNRQPIWIVFFAWTLIVINLVLIMANLEANSWQFAFQSAFVFAFLTAQIGLLIFWGILGTTDWRWRVPIAIGLFILSAYPYWSYIGRSSSWLPVMTGYIISVTLTCAVLRFWRFRIDSDANWTVKAKGGRLDQFGIKHLFIWTTLVATLIGTGRFVPWTTVFALILDTSALLLISRALLMTLIIVATAWTVLGKRKGAWLRCLVLLGILAAIGAGFYGLDLNTPTNRVKLAGWVPQSKLIQIWMVWTILNGLFLAGLFLAIRTSGRQLARVKKIRAAK